MSSPFRSLASSDHSSARIAIAPRRFHGDAHASGAWRRRQLFFERTLMDCIARAHALPVGLHMPGPDAGDAVAADYASLCDGLVLQGGTDIAPARSGASSSAESDTDRDAYELALVFAFLRRDKPVLGICRGMQLINVAMGGTLRTIAAAEDVARHSDPTRYAEHAHAIELVHEGYLAHLYEYTRGEVSSAHRQAVRELGTSLVAEAHCPLDRAIEAVRSTRHRYAIGVQWHPELDEIGNGRLDGARLLADFVRHASVPELDLNKRPDATTCMKVHAL